MQLSSTQTMIIILAVALGTIVTRFTPFLLFPENKKVPKYITYLGKVLPPSMMGLLVIYCFKGVSVLKAPYGIPEGIATLVIILLHKWKNNVLLSIGGGSLLYMILVQLVF